MNAGKRQGGTKGGVVLLERGGGRRLFLSRAEINHGAEAIMCNSTPARLVTLVT